MIAKKIFYVWLGKQPLSQEFEKCFASWNRYCGDYEIIKINEVNAGIDDDKVLSYFYNRGEYSFASDIIRAKILAKESGFYFDTDIELVRPIDELLKYDFIVQRINDSLWKYNTAFMGSQAGNRILLDSISKSTINEIPLATLNRVLESEKNSININFLESNHVILPEMTITSDTFAIHHTKRDWVKDTILLDDKQKQVIQNIRERVMSYPFIKS